MLGIDGACDSFEGPLEAGLSFSDALLLEVPVLFRLNPPARILPIPPCLTPYEASLNASSDNNIMFSRWGLFCTASIILYSLFYYRYRPDERLLPQIPRAMMRNVSQVETYNSKISTYIGRENTNFSIQVALPPTLSDIAVQDSDNSVLLQRQFLGCLC